MQQSSELDQGRLKTFALYGVMVGASAAAFHALVTHGSTLVAPAGALPSPVAAAAPRSHGGDLFHVLVALLVVLAVSRALGSLFRFINQPPVIGEVLAGVMLGPSLLGRLAPELAGRILPAEIAPLLGILAQIGVVLYMFLVGLELDTKLLRKSAHATLCISHASIVAPLLLGTALALWLFPTLAGPATTFMAFALFMGLSLSITAFPVLARILTDAGLHTNRLGALALGCAAVDDVTAWCLLAMLEGLVRAQAGTGLLTVALTLVYVALMLGVVGPLVRRFCARQDARVALAPGTVALALGALLVSALLAELIGVHALFGAFLLGALVPSRSLVARELTAKIKDLVVILLLPAFFAFTGMRTRLSLIDGLEAWLSCGLIVAIACLGKVGGSAAAARFSGLSWRDATGLGILMNTRGLVELIVLNIGLELGIISPTLFAMMVVMAVVTTLMTAPALRVLLGASHFHPRRASSPLAPPERTPVLVLEP